MLYFQSDIAPGLSAPIVPWRFFPPLFLLWTGFFHTICFEKLIDRKKPRKVCKLFWTFQVFSGFICKDPFNQCLGPRSSFVFNFVTCMADPTAENCRSAVDGFCFQFPYVCCAELFIGFVYQRLHRELFVEVSYSIRFFQSRWRIDCLQLASVLYLA